MLGIGFALAKLALASNAKVIIADLEPSPSSARLVDNHENARFIKCDVRRWGDLASIMPFSEKEFGDVTDIFAANAGVPEIVGRLDPC